MTSMSLAIFGVFVMLGSGVYGYYRDPMGSAPVILMIAGFGLTLIGLALKGGKRSGRGEE